MCFASDDAMGKAKGRHYLWSVFGDDSNDDNNINFNIKIRTKLTGCNQ